jgi:MoaA/NifB/PqqE/SkfB family radical SAM enzyme
MPGPTSLWVNLHATPCTNRCRHCWAEGTPRHGSLPFSDVAHVLTKLAAVRPEILGTGFLLFDEPTTHPQFVEIMELAAGLELTGEHTFLATNGSILAHAPDETWDRLAAAGMGALQLTAYGLEKTHDSFAGRKGSTPA